MRTFALRSLALVGGLAVLASTDSGRASLVRCAGAAFASDETASTLCSGALVQLGAVLFGALLLFGAIVNLVDYIRFREIGEPPQPALLAGIVTAGVMVAALAIVRAQFVGLATTTSVDGAVARALGVIGTLGAALGGAMILAAAIALWLGKRPRAR